MKESPKPDGARILVVGAGTNGSICAARMCDARINVTLLARGKRADDIRTQGVVIEDVLQGTRSETRVSVIEELGPDDLYDYILVVVRKNQVEDLLPILAHNQTPNIVFMVNNPSGPEEWTAALGKERVMMGFVFGAGRREGSVIRGISSLGSGLVGRLLRTPFGELNGAITPRLTRLIGIFRQAGLNAGVSKRISEYLATHAALVAVMASFAMARGIDRESMSRYTRADIGLLVDGMREVLGVIRSNGVRITPPSITLIKVVPRWLQVVALRAMFRSRFFEVGGAYHMSQAPDEMAQLIGEVRILVEKSGRDVPALRTVLGMVP
jgi:2-dehydropantoate 2-reductase